MDSQDEMQGLRRHNEVHCGLAYNRSPLRTSPSRPTNRNDPGRSECGTALMPYHGPVQQWRATEHHLGFSSAKRILFARYGHGVQIQSGLASWLVTWRDGHPLIADAASPPQLRAWRGRGFHDRVGIFDGVVHRHLNDRMTRLDRQSRRLSGIRCCVGALGLPVNLEQVPAQLRPLTLSEGFS
jgi:hypothetical protein